MDVDGGHETDSDPLTQPKDINLTKTSPTLIQASTTEKMAVVNQKDLSNDSGWIKVIKHAKRKQADIIADATEPHNRLIKSRIQQRGGRSH